MISTRLVELVIDTVVCLTLAKWETVSGQFGGYFTERPLALRPSCLTNWEQGRRDLSLGSSLTNGRSHWKAWRIANFRDRRGVCYIAVTIFKLLCHRTLVC